MLANFTNKCKRKENASREAQLSGLVPKKKIWRLLNPKMRAATLKAAGPLHDRTGCSAKFSPAQLRPTPKKKT
jgi:hypothetical protein